MIYALHMISADADDIRFAYEGTDIISYCDAGAIYHAVRQHGISYRVSDISFLVFRSYINA